MKALCVTQPWAAMIACGMKTIETRTWATSFRGDFLLVSSAKPKINGLLYGCALAIVRLADCRPMTKEDEEAACCAIYPNAWAWEIDCVRLIKPFKVKGSLKFFDVDVPKEHEYGHGHFADLGIKVFYLDCLKLYMEGKGD